MFTVESPAECVRAVERNRGGSDGNPGSIPGAPTTGRGVSVPTLDDRRPIRMNLKIKAVSPKIGTDIPFPLRRWARPGWTCAPVWMSR